MLDVVNRGNKTVLTGFNRSTNANEPGDALLMRMGYTIVWVGWEFDVPQRNGAIRIDVPAATGAAGLVRALVTPTATAPRHSLAIVAGYTPSETGSLQNTLTVRDGSLGGPLPIPRNQWTLNGNTVTLEGGFEAGRTYELSYLAVEPTGRGPGFRGSTRHCGMDQVRARCRRLHETGAGLRFLSKRPFPAELPLSWFQRRRKEPAGVRRCHRTHCRRVSHRSEQPLGHAHRLGQFNATSFPFADVSQRDPATGTEEGALDNSRAYEFKPKIFYTNTGVEYWGGGRSAALIHTTPDGTKDLSLPDHERVYFLSGSQHGPARFPPAAARNGQQQENPVDYWYVMRALLVSMDKWMRDGTAPPASQYPKLQDRTLVKASEVAFPNIPGVTSPRGLRAAVRGANPLIFQDGAPGTTLPFLVPQTDKDGIELAGIRLPDIAVPLATYTGWNFRNASVGGADSTVPAAGFLHSFSRDGGKTRRIQGSSCFDRRALRVA